MKENRLWGERGAGPVFEMPRPRAASPELPPETWRKISQPGTCWVGVPQAEGAAGTKAPAGNREGRAAPEVAREGGREGPHQTPRGS